MVPINPESLARRLADMGACDDATAWAINYSDAVTAWAECRRGDWMLWLVARCRPSQPWSDERKPLVACAMECTFLLERRWPESHRKQLDDAIEVMRRWTRSEASTEDARAAQRQLLAYAAASATDADAAAAAASATYSTDADADDAVEAAYDAVEAAYIAAAATCAVNFADANAIYAAASTTCADAADEADAAAEAQTRTLAACADIVRRHFPTPPKLPE